MEAHAFASKSVACGGLPFGRLRADPGGSGHLFVLRPQQTGLAREHLEAHAAKNDERLMRA